MSKKSVLDSLRVASPCREDWDEMRGNDKVRFCSHCEKSVNNISEMTPKEAIRLARRSNGNICIRYRVDPATKAPVFASRFHQLTRSPLAATGVVAATLALSSAGYAQGEMKPRAANPVAYVESEAESCTLEPETTAAYGSISGKVHDENGALVPNAMIRIANEKTEEFFETLSDSDGQYEFKNVASGSYTVTANWGGDAVNKTIKNITVSDGIETDLNIEMKFENVAIMGLVVTTSVEYKNPLTFAVSDEDIDAVRDLIAAGEDVNFAEEDKTTPIFVAVQNGYTEIAATLIDFGADLNVRKEEGRTPLMMINANATPELVKLLIDSGAKVNMTDDEGNTALMMAADRGLNTEILKVLIDAGTDVNVTNK